MQKLAIYGAGQGAAGATFAAPIARVTETTPALIDDAAPMPVEATLRLLLESKRSDCTKRTYAAGIRHFATWLHGGFEGCLESLGAFLSYDEKAASLVLHRYKAGMLTACAKENTINARLSAVRALLFFAYRTGASRVNGAGLIEGEPAKTYRDTRGYDIETLMDLLDQPFLKYGSDTIAGKRDFAILLVLCETGLRRAEVAALDVGDFSMREKRLAYIGKGKGTQKERMTISPRVAGALGDYLFLAGHAWDKIQLFRNCSRDPNVAGNRLTGEAIRLIVRGYGRSIGIDDVSPHKFRHSGATIALELTNGNIRKVKKFTRHVKSETVEIYDDNRQDLQGEVSNMISEALKRKGRRK